MNKVKAFIFFLLFLSVVPVLAKDPVAWRLDKTFQDPIFIGRSYTITYTFTSQLPLTMVKPIVIDKNAMLPNEFTFVDNCSGKKLTPGQQCTVQVTLVPTVAGNKFLQLAITGYDNNYVKLPGLATTAQGESHEAIYAVVTQSLPGSSQSGEAESYLFSFTNRTNASVTNISAHVNQTSGVATFSTTCGSSLAAGATCTITGSYNPTASPSVQTVTGSLDYGTGSTTSIATSTTVSTTSGVVGSFVGSNYLPAVMVGGPSNQKTLWFLFTNNGPGSVTISTGTIAATVGGSIVTLTPVFNHCSGATLVQTAACDMQATFEANTVVSPTPVTVTGTVNYTGGSGTTASLSTSTTVVAALGTSRTVTFLNQCSFPVWFSLNGGQLTSSPTCSSDAQCPTGTSCSSVNNKCFWKNYAPNGSGGGSTPYELAANGGTNTVTIPLTSADPNVQWSGNFSASLGCDNSSSCSQASCGNSGGTTACAAGVGFSQPATEAEITMNISTSDSYDVETINGFHIPISMTPGPFVTPNNYVCGVPGAFTAGNGFGSCNWQNAAPPGNGYYWVTSGGAACNISSPSCSSASQICGLDSSLNQVCGNFLGYWSANQVCSLPNVPAQVSSFFQCTTPLAGLSSSVSFPSGSTLYDLMACAVPKGDVQPTYNSCYLTYSGVPANNELPCCGCIDWWTVSGINANPNTQSCTQSGQSTPQTDPVWNQYIQNQVAWMKKSCPQAYTYPFDDKSSSFTCTNTLPGESNSVGYTITFCEGNSGLPAGKTEGRT
jgi:hypothetical protein